MKKTCLPYLFRALYPKRAAGQARGLTTQDFLWILLILPWCVSSVVFQLNVFLSHFPQPQKGNSQPKGLMQGLQFPQGTEHKTPP